ncbi:hypothetical protein NBRC113063_00798 [Apilactobacillus micheneri]|nr:hypothetical protein NBRC113063_00798 [Apilactobacillus micheneri]
MTAKNNNQIDINKLIDLVANKLVKEIKQEGKKYEE